jgi:cytochrome c
MKFSVSSKQLTQVLAPMVATALLGLSASAFAADVDVDGASAVLKKNNCTKCHSVDKDKSGPSFKKTAAALKGKPDAEAKLIKHLTTGPMVKVDGAEEKHKVIVATDAELKNVIQYILSR